MLSSTPKIYNQNKSFNALEAWAKLSPLAIQDILRYSAGHGGPLIDGSTLEYKEVKTQYGMVTGQFRKGTDIIEGIARQVTFSNQI